MHPEQQAFERAIDENPTEANNHLAYADWLDENGQPEEAAFRRSLGKWFTSKEWNKHNPTYGHEMNVGDVDFPIRVHSERLPEGVDAKDVPNIQFRDSSYRTLLESPHLGLFSSGRLAARNYRHLESNLRQAFMKGLEKRQLQRKKRLARSYQRIYSK